MWQTGKETISRTPAPLSDLNVCVIEQMMPNADDGWTQRHPNKLKLPAINFKFRMGRRCSAGSATPVKWNHIYLLTLYLPAVTSPFHMAGKPVSILYVLFQFQHSLQSIRYVCLFAIAKIHASNRQHKSTTLCTISESLGDVAISLQLASFVRNFEFF